MAPFFGSTLKKTLPLQRKTRKLSLYRSKAPPLDLTVKYPLTAEELSSLVGSEVEVPSLWVHFYFEGEELRPNVCPFFLL